MVDVVNKRCQHPGCKKRPVFGFEGEKGRFCSLHRSGVSFVPKKLLVLYVLYQLVPVRVGLRVLPYVRILHYISYSTQEHFCIFPRTLVMDDFSIGFVLRLNSLACVWCLVMGFSVICTGKC